MSYELNLNNDQKRRIDGAKTPKEKAAIIREAMDAPIELSNDELDAMSGGQQVRIPPTHEEIDHAWDLIEAISKAYDEDTALAVAYEKKLIPVMHVDCARSYWTRSSMSSERARMHRAFDANR